MTKRGMDSWLVALLFCCMACHRPVSVKAPLVYPAAAPIRAFPSIVIAGGDAPDGDLGARLTQYLEKDGQHHVQRVSLADLEPMRAAGAFTPLSLVVVIHVAVFPEAEGGSQLQQVHVCTPNSGCYIQYQPTYGYAPQLGGEVVLTMYDGPSAQQLQTLSLRASVRGQDLPDRRKQLLEVLGLKLERAVDVIRSETKVELEPVRKHPLVKDALAHIEKGEWDKGRALLETAAQHLQGLKPDVQARILYDLGVARWYEPGAEGLTDEVYMSAKHALEQALKLDGTPRYRRAIDALERARKRAEVLQEQRDAARHNYALVGAVPAPTGTAEPAAPNAEHPPQPATEPAGRAP